MQYKSSTSKFLCTILTWIACLSWLIGTAVYQGLVFDNSTRTSKESDNGTNTMGALWLIGAFLFMIVFIIECIASLSKGKGVWKILAICASLLQVLGAFMAIVASCIWLAEANGESLNDNGDAMRGTSIACGAMWLIAFTYFAAEVLLGMCGVCDKPCQTMGAIGLLTCWVASVFLLVCYAYERTIGGITIKALYADDVQFAMMYCFTIFYCAGVSFTSCDKGSFVTAK